MDATSPERYAVVSCHVERPLDDAVWPRFAELQRSRPGGFRIAALIRPPDLAHGEDEAQWLERARAAAEHGPLGHHTHWTAPDHARPTTGGTGERVLSEGRRLRELGLAPTLFCGGGWYTDAAVAEACAELGYVDCTLRTARPPYLPRGERWASFAMPAAVQLPSGRTLLALPTTHSLGDASRALVRSFLPRRVAGSTRSDLSPFVHVYFHDTDLLDRRRRALLECVLHVLAWRATRSDLDELGVAFREEAPHVPWSDVEQA